MLRATCGFAVALSLAVSAPAWACVEAMEDFELDQGRQELRVAKKHFNAGRYEKALKVAEHAMDELATDDGTYQGLLRIAATSQLRLGQAKEAREDLEMLVELGDASAYVLARLGEAELATGDTEAGVARLSRLQKKKRLPDADAHAALARGLADQGHLAQAVSTARVALKLRPGHPVASQVVAEHGRGALPTALVRR